jgi:hypothetical protein
VKYLNLFHEYHFFPHLLKLQVSFLECTNKKVAFNK